MSYLFGVPLSPGEAASVAAVGLGTAGFALVVGRRFFRRPAASLAGERPSSDPAPPQLSSYSERRSCPRRRGNFVAAQLADDSDVDPAEVWVVDRSLGGLCLLVDAPIDVGSRLRVRPRQAGGSTNWIPVNVRACNRDADGWLIHCQFLRVPPTNVMLLFG